MERNRQRRGLKGVAEGSPKRKCIQTISFLESISPVGEIWRRCTVLTQCCQKPISRTSPVQLIHSAFPPLWKKGKHTSTFLVTPSKTLVAFFQEIFFPRSQEDIFHSSVQGGLTDKEELLFWLDSGKEGQHWNLDLQNNNKKKQ